MHCILCSNIVFPEATVLPKEVLNNLKSEKNTHHLYINNFQDKIVIKQKKIKFSILFG